jgi:DNA repair protein RadD
MIAQQARQWDGRTIVLAHRKELLKQNAEKIRLLLPDMKVGLFSAGLNQRDTEADVVCAGIQSVYNKAFEFGRRELIVIDECHLIPPDGDGMYQQFLRDIQTICPDSRIIGLTATPYRCNSGPLTGRGRIFDQACYEVTTGRLIEEGFLCPLTNKPSQTTIDTSSFKVRAGEFVSASMSAVFNHIETVTAACREIVAKTAGRKCCLLFCCGVDHAETVADVMGEMTGESVPVITGETPPILRAGYLNSFQRGEHRFLVNCDVLTTGFDNPRIDTIAVLRSTMSPGLFAQIVGRGLRMHPGKQDTLVLDFGGNIKRHGSLDDPEYGRAEFRSAGSSAEERNGRGKLCPNCEIDVPAACRECQDCGFNFPPPERVQHDSFADDESSILGVQPPKTWIVEEVRCKKHLKKKSPDAPPTLRVIYSCVPVEADDSLSDDEVLNYYEWNTPSLDCPHCGSVADEVTVHPEETHFAKLTCAMCATFVKWLPHPRNISSGNLSGKEFSEWVCLEHDGFARSKAEQWWNERSDAPVPGTIDDAIDTWPSCRQPVRIVVSKDGRWDRISHYEFEDEKPEEWPLPFELAGEEVPF